MTLLNKMSMAAATSAAAFLAMGTVGTTPAQAALYKFSFTADEAAGYFIFDNSVPNTGSGPSIGEYDGAVREYTIDLGANGFFQGSSAGTVVYLRNIAARGPNTPPTDDFILTTGGENPYEKPFLSAIFSYPVGSLGSIAQPTAVPPSTQPSGIFPEVDLNARTLGEAAFSGTFQTRIEAVPEPSSAVFGVGAWFILLYRRQLRQALCIQNWCRVGRKSKTF